MRRRSSINVWPAFADLMTVLAVGSLFVALAMSWDSRSGEELLARMRTLEVQNRELKSQLDKHRDFLTTKEAEWKKDREVLQQEVREAARNEQMFKAIQEAQKAIDAISETSGLKFGIDQSLEFGDDLVTFNLNSDRPIWRIHGKERLRRFCAAISEQVTERELSIGNFIVQVGGHSDSLKCPDEPHCNWRISSSRAASFLAFMKNPDYCPGGHLLVLQPVGFADTKSPPGEMPTRRIAVRMVPNYERLARSLEKF